LKESRQKLFLELEKVGQEAFEIKEKMIENTKEKDQIEETLTDILLKEKSVEEEIKLLEKKEEWL